MVRLNSRAEENGRKSPDFGRKYFRIFLTYHYRKYPAINVRPERIF